MIPMTGGCSCGKLRYTVDAEPLFSALCHYKTCKKQTGSAFRITVAAPRAAVSLEGAQRTYTGMGDSGQQSNQSVLSQLWFNCCDRARSARQHHHYPGRVIRRDILVEAYDGNLLR